MIRCLECGLVHEGPFCPLCGGGYVWMNVEKILRESNFHWRNLMANTVFGIEAIYQDEGERCC